MCNWFGMACFVFFFVFFCKKIFQSWTPPFGVYNVKLLCSGRCGTGSAFLLVKSEEAKILVDLQKDYDRDCGTG